MQTVRQMLNSAVALGYKIKAGSEDVVDYEGASPSKAIAALEALDGLGYITIVNERGYRCGSATIVPDLDDDDSIADAGGWVNDWMDENIDY